MKLYIDTSKVDKITIGLDSEIIQAEATKQRSQALLPMLTYLLGERGKTLKDITEIEVNTGPGSFTGLRVGISIANTLGWELDIPVNGIKIAQKGPIESHY